MAQAIIDLGSVANDGTGDDLRTGGGKINDNFTEIYSNIISDNFKIVNSLSDLPTAVANVITLEDDVAYLINGRIDTMGSRVVCAASNFIKGTSNINAELFSSVPTTGAFIQSDNNIQISDILFTGTDIDELFNCIGGGGHNFIVTNCVFQSFEVNCGLIGDYDSVVFSGCLFNNCALLKFDGGIGDVVFDNCHGTPDSANVLIQLLSSFIVLYSFRVSNCFFIVNVTGTAIDANASATIPTRGYILENNRFIGSSATYITGIDRDSAKARFVDNEGISNSIITTGWEAVVDTVDTVGSPQAIAQGVTDELTNNAGTTFNTQLPVGVTSFWDTSTSKVTPENENDFMTSSFMFKAKNDNIDGHFTLFIDIPSLGERFTSVHRFPKGANTEHGFDIDICHFVSNQFSINGGIVKITANLGDLEIYDKQFRFCRVHKAL